MFGPDTIHVRGQMSFTDFWQIYPKAIAALSFAIGGLFLSLSQKKWESVTHFFEEEVEVINTEKIKIENYFVMPISEKVFVFAEDEKSCIDFIDNNVVAIES